MHYHQILCLVIQFLLLGRLFYMTYFSFKVTMLLLHDLLFRSQNCFKFRLKVLIPILYQAKQSYYDFLVPCFGRRPTVLSLFNFILT